ncbi:glycosyltransferase family 4 protein [Tessaracoccus sp. MC1627]|nr:glycosyltransferase family 4 protein [Tessaracoccus sp. MC1627]
MTREKGIPDAAAAIRMLNAKGTAATLDVIGPVGEDFSKEFSAILDENPYVRYLGVVPPENAAAVLNGYFAIVFPTRWRGEGVPGSIIDALAAGVPIISYRWRFHDEMLTEGITGFSTSPGNVAGLARLLERLTAQTRTERNLMRLNCLAKARDYAPDVIVARMLDDMNLTGERP